MPDFFESDRQPRSGDYAAVPELADLMRRHGDGGRCPLCSVTRCRTWQDAHVSDIMSAFLDSPTVRKAVER